AAGPLAAADARPRRRGRDVADAGVPLAHARLAPRRHQRGGGGAGKARLHRAPPAARPRARPRAARGGQLRVLREQRARLPQRSRICARGARTRLAGRLMDAKTLFDGKHVLVRERDGWEFVERKKGKSAVAIVVRTSDGKIVLTEQYRRPVDARVI